MAIRDEDVRHVARLARLRLDAGEVSLFRGQLSRVLDYMAELEELDTGPVPPTSHVLGLSNALRDDKAAPRVPVDKILDNAPAAEGRHFKVPKVIV